MILRLHARLTQKPRTHAPHIRLARTPHTYSSHARATQKPRTWLSHKSEFHFALQVSVSWSVPFYLPSEFCSFTKLLNTIITSRFIIKLTLKRTRWICARAPLTVLWSRRRQWQRRRLWRRCYWCRSRGWNFIPKFCALGGGERRRPVCAWKYDPFYEQRLKLRGNFLDVIQLRFRVLEVQLGGANGSASWRRVIAECWLVQGAVF